MGNGNKKNKRGSIPSPSSLSVSAKTELIDRTPENDYGVLSDPEEQPITTMEYDVAQEPTVESSATKNHSGASAVNAPSMNGDIRHLDPPLLVLPSQSSCLLPELSSPPNAPNTPPNAPTSDSVPVLPAPTATVFECNHNLDEPSPKLHSSPQLPPLSQEQYSTIQPPISQTLAFNKSLETLKVKLAKDKNFSRKINLHTFFSFIILAMEIQRSCSASIAQLCVQSVQELIVYMIDNHSSSNPVRIYLHTLVDTGIVNNIVESIIEFNKDNKNSSIETLYSTEENELELYILQTSSSASATTAATATTATTATTAATATAATTATADDGHVIEISDIHLTQTPQKCGFFKRMLSFFSGCCGCK